MLTNINKSNLKKISSPQPLIVKSYKNFSRAMYYALLGIVTEVISDREKDKKQQLLQNNGRIEPERLDDAQIAKDIYDKIGRLYPDSTFNVIVVNSVGGEFQYSYSKEKTAYLAVASGNRVFMIFKYK